MASATRTFVVTGASTGIGRSCAVELAKRGHRVLAGVRKEADADAIRKEGLGLLSPLLLDVTDASSIEATAKTVESEVGAEGLAGLVNNAGVAMPAPLEYVDLDDLRRQFEVNVIGLVAVTQAMMPALRKARGRVVNIGSIGGRVANPLMGPYCGSKFAVEGMSDALRSELAPWGMHVSVVEPGTIETPIFEKSDAEAEERLQRMPAEARQRYQPLIDAIRATVQKNLKSATPPEKVADAVIHALTASRPRTRYVVGTDAKAQVVMRALLPDRWLDAVLNRVIGAPRRLD